MVMGLRVCMESICGGTGRRPGGGVLQREVRLYVMEKNLVTVCGYEILVIDEKERNVKR